MVASPVYRRPPTGQLDDPSADYAEQLTRLDPISAKQVVDFSMAASTSAQYAPHGLGKAYRGAIVVGQDGATPVRVLLPSLSPDARRRVAVQQSTATAQTIRLLVF